MIKGVRECPTMQAISANPEIHSGWIEEFWMKAKAVKDGDSVTTKVDEKKLRMTKADDKRALNFKDSPRHYIERLTKGDMKRFCETNWV